jgi:two-component system, cell cycle sensor histidine kinase DivJ
VQVDDHTSRRYQGTGLGLSIVKCLVELHGGVFILHSIVGIGTIAILRFPPSRVVECEAFAKAA